MSAHCRLGLLAIVLLQRLGDLLVLGKRFIRHLAVKAQPENVQVNVQATERLRDQLVTAAACDPLVKLGVLIGELVV